MNIKDDDEDMKLSDFINYEIAGSQIKKKFEKNLDHTGFVAGYLQSLIKSQVLLVYCQSKLTPLNTTYEYIAGIPNNKSKYSRKDKTFVIFGPSDVQI